LKTKLQEDVVLAAEWTVILVNASILCVAYFFVYPRFAGADMNKLLINDLLANATALLVAGFLFYGSGQRFTFIFFDLGWFGFALLTFVVMELPFFWSYARRHGLFTATDERNP
jgi:hypothetical protein